MLLPGPPPGCCGKHPRCRQLTVGPGSAQGCLTAAGMDDAVRVFLLGRGVGEAFRCEVKVLDGGLAFRFGGGNGLGHSGVDVVRHVQGYLFVRPWGIGLGGLAGQFDLKPAPAAQDAGGEVHLE